VHSRETSAVSIGFTNDQDILKFISRTQNTNFYRNLHGGIRFVLEGRTSRYDEARIHFPQLLCERP